MYKVFVDNHEVYRSKSGKKAKEVFLAVYRTADILIGKMCDYEVVLCCNDAVIDKIGG